jgi:hypothetical protein
MKITPSQQCAIDRLKKYFEQGDKTPHIFEIIQNGGLTSVRVETTANLLTMNGGLFHIGRRGAITVAVAFGLGNKNDRAKHYTQILGGR